MQPSSCDRMFRRRLPVAAVLALTAIAFAAPAPAAAAAKVLDAAAVKALLADRAWTATAGSSGTVRYWSWKSDGSLCYRMFEKDGKCDDTGRWKLDRNRVCYELSWFGKNEGLNSKCFPVVDLGQGRYAGIEDNGVHFMNFTVTE